MAKLNPKYKKIIDKWFELGCGAGDGATAWIEYNKTNNRDAARVEFYRILQIPTVSDYVTEKQKQNQELLMKIHHVGMGDIIKKLKKMAIDGTMDWMGVDVAIKAPEVLRAIDQLIKIIGGYAVEKKDITSNGETIGIDVTVEIIKPEGFEAES